MAIQDSSIDDSIPIRDMKRTALVMFLYALSVVFGYTCIKNSEVQSLYLVAGYMAVCGISTWLYTIGWFHPANYEKTRGLTGSSFEVRIRN
jgi:hypothetical protein